ncbi:hypothetical protein OUZ56_018706 [Daphnia magna]|uniref:Uncharacterized protein n=1 Tax=Daphnia magna TaxID=35525 RepID=A0ABQ9Z9K8_9CRUS|nr:hypothetical protein OUZ56_018706 [Daphnia magna]
MYDSEKKQSQPIRQKPIRQTSNLPNRPYTVYLDDVLGVDNPVADALSRNPAESSAKSSDSQTKETCRVALNTPETGFASNEIALLQQQDGEL